MNGRGLATPAVIVLVLLVGGLALVDSLRGCETTTTRVAPTIPTVTEEPPPTTTTTDTGPAPQEDAPDDWPTGELDGVLTYVAADDCRVRTIGLSSGRPRPPSRFVTDCRGFWAPKVGSRIAFGEVLSEGFFTVADLGHPRGDAGSYPIGAATAPMWSPEGRHIAWCDSPNTGIELEMLGEGRLLDFCPAAYTADGELGRVTGNDLFVGDRRILTAPGPIEFVQFGVDGSVGVVVGGTLYRYASDAPTTSTNIARLDPSGPPVLSPDTCTAAVPTAMGVFVVPLSCSPTIDRLVEGTSPAWSPDGAWLAVAGEQAITFQGIDAIGTVTWPATATQLQWRTG